MKQWMLAGSATVKKAKEIIETQLALMGIPNRVDYGLNCLKVYVFEKKKEVK